MNHAAPVARLLLMHKVVGDCVCGAHSADQRGGYHMMLLLYAVVPSEVQEQAMRALEPLLPDGTVQVYQTINDLSRRLRQPKDDLTIVVLLLGSREDVLDILNIRHLFRGVRIVLVVPDLDYETITLAHRLRPRYLTYIGGNFLEISTVINKMCEGYAQSQWLYRSQNTKRM